MLWDCHRSLCIILPREVVYLLGCAFAISIVCNTFHWELIWMKLILFISYLSRAVTCCFTSVAFFLPEAILTVLEATARIFHSLGKCIFRSALDRSVQINCDVFLMLCEQIVSEAPSRILGYHLCLGKCPAASHRKFCVKPALCICPVLSSICFSPQLETRQCIKQFFVLVCCYLILGQSSWGFFCLSSGAYHPRMACTLHLGGHGISNTLNTPTKK